jgi:hypothetical protein
MSEEEPYQALPITDDAGGDHLQDTGHGELYHLQELVLVP